MSSTKREPVWEPLLFILLSFYLFCAAVSGLSFLGRTLFLKSEARRENLIPEDALPWFAVAVFRGVFWPIYFPWSLVARNLLQGPVLPKLDQASIEPPGPKNI